MNAKSVCVLIPVYNESRNIGRVCAAVLAQGVSVLVVDDGSSDGTVQEVERLGVPCIRSRVNEGKGASLRKGFEWFMKSPWEAVILMDGDGQHDPGQLEQFVRAISENRADMVIGNRMQNPMGMPWLRRATNWGMSALISLIAGQRVPDTQCGYRALKKRVLEKIKLSTERFEIESELILQAAKSGFRISSIPIRSVYEGEESQIHPCRDTCRFIAFIFSYLLKRKR